MSARFSLHDVEAKLKAERAACAKVAADYAAAWFREAQNSLSARSKKHAHLRADTAGQIANLIRERDAP